MKKKKPTWYEAARRGAYESSLGPDCSLYVQHAGDGWNWSVGWGSLAPRGQYEPVGGEVVEHGRTKTRGGAMTAAVRVGRRVCPVKRW